MRHRNNRVLVFRTGHLGDTVCAIPAFRLLRQHFQDAELTLLCDRPHGTKVAAADVVSGLGVFDRILTYVSGLGLVTAWQLAVCVRQVRPDVLVMLPQVRQSAKNVCRKKQFFRWCGVKDVRGMYFRSPGQSEPTRLIQMLNEVGVHGAKPAYDIPMDNAARGRVEQKLRELDVKAGTPFLLFCGGGKDSVQRWPLTRYAMVLRTVASELHWPVLGLGSPAEVEGYRRDVLPVFPELRLLTGELSIPEIFEFCRMAVAYVGNDTGPMHVAAAVGRPVVVIMSGRASDMWDPDVEPKMVIRQQVECENCFLSDCVTAKHRCMTEISVEDVQSKVLPFLSLLPQRSAVLR